MGTGPGLHLHLHLHFPSTSRLTRDSCMAHAFLLEHCTIDFRLSSLGTPVWPTAPDVIVSKVLFQQHSKLTALYQNLVRTWKLSKMVSEAKWSWHIMWKCHWVPQFTLHHQTSPQTGCIHQLCVPQVSQGTNHNSESNMKFSKQCTTVKKITGLCKPFTRELRKWAGLNPALLKLNTGRASSANRYHFCYNY